jgi:hypothetical protein
VTYDNWKTTEPDPGDYEPFGECHWCGYRCPRRSSSQKLELASYSYK